MKEEEKSKQTVDPKNVERLIESEARKIMLYADIQINLLASLLLVFSQVVTINVAIIIIFS